MKTRRLAVLCVALVLVVLTYASAYAFNGGKVVQLKQVAVTLPNEPGSLNKMTQVIADRKININGLTIGKGETEGAVMLMVDDAAATSAVLKEAGFSNSIEEVIGVELPNVPGSMNALLAVFTEAGLNIEYLYLFVPVDNSGVYHIFGFKDVEKAVSVLKEAGAEIK